jgi:hypothetical protein
MFGSAGWSELSRPTGERDFCDCGLCSCPKQARHNLARQHPMDHRRLGTDLDRGAQRPRRPRGV